MRVLPSPFACLGGNVTTRYIVFHLAQSEMSRYDSSLDNEQVWQVVTAGDGQPMFTDDPDDYARVNDHSQKYLFIPTEGAFTAHVRGHDEFVIDGIDRVPYGEIEIIKVRQS